MTSVIALNRRAARARRLRDEGLSVRQIAEALKVAKSTAHADLRRGVVQVAPVPNLQDAQGRPVAGAEPGNSRAMTHGANSEKRVAPLREKHVAELRRDYPRLDGRRLILLADRLARIEAASAWLDQQDGLVRDENGEVFAVVKALETWSTRAETLLAEIEAENRKASRFEGLEGYLEGDDDEDGDDDGTSGDE